MRKINNRLENFIAEAIENVEETQNPRTLADDVAEIKEGLEKLQEILAPFLKGLGG